MRTRWPILRAYPPCAPGTTRSSVAYIPARGGTPCSVTRSIGRSLSNARPATSRIRDARHPDPRAWTLGSRFHVDPQIASSRSRAAPVLSKGRAVVLVRALSSVGESTSLTRRGSGVRVPQRPHQLSALARAVAEPSDLERRPSHPRVATWAGEYRGPDASTPHDETRTGIATWLEGVLGRPRLETQGARVGAPPDPLHAVHGSFTLAFPRVRVTIRADVVATTSLQTDAEHEDRAE